MTEWQPSLDGLANCMRRVAAKPIGDLIRETDPEGFKPSPPVYHEHITDEALQACLIEARLIGRPDYLAAKKSRIERERRKAFTDRQKQVGANILARINEREKTA